jgi:hypothetical protein
LVGLGFSTDEFKVKTVYNRNWIEYYYSLDGKKEKIWIVLEQFLCFAEDTSFRSEAEYRHFSELFMVLNTWSNLAIVLWSKPLPRYFGIGHGRCRRHPSYP